MGGVLMGWDHSPPRRGPIASCTWVAGVCTWRRHMKCRVESAVGRAIRVGVGAAGPVDAVSAAGRPRARRSWSRPWDTVIAEIRAPSADVRPPRQPGAARADPHGGCDGLGRCECAALPCADAGCFGLTGTFIRVLEGMVVLGRERTDRYGAAGREKQTPAAVCQPAASDPKPTFYLPLDLHRLHKGFGLVQLK